MTDLFDEMFPEVDRWDVERADDAHDIDPDEDFEYDDPTEDED